VCVKSHLSQIFVPNSNEKLSLLWQNK